MKYSEVFMDWLKEEGYTHCFFVGGGNVMHLLESASKRFICIPVVHEVAGGIAAEYFNEVTVGDKRAFVMVTAGPGITNLVTAVGGAWLENRELLIIGGQAKRSDLSRGRVRQTGHQEIDGVGILQPITKASVLADRQLSEIEVKSLCRLTKTGKRGPVFIEMCIDVTAEPFNDGVESKIDFHEDEPLAGAQDFNSILEILRGATRPLFLIGGGVSRETMAALLPTLDSMKIPVATTFNGADRVGSDFKYYCGRPNWYGMRWANILLQQCDVLIALGTRLGIQQTGFQWDEFAPVAKIVQVEIDLAELTKGFPKLDLAVKGDANLVLTEILQDRTWCNPDVWSEWHQHILLVRNLLENVDSANIASEDYVELQSFLFDLSNYTVEDDIIIPCSSGGSFTGMMQMFRNKTGQMMVTDKSLASMGYGLSGAIGAALAYPEKRTILVEGDGGFAQNLQELGTASNLGLNLKILIAENQGYASIRTTQKAYFNNNYVGCDSKTGLGMPDWTKLFDAFGIEVMSMDQKNLFSQEFREGMEKPGLFACIVRLDPDQLYFPKLTSKVLPSGQMASSALHEMNPKLSEEIAIQVFKWIKVDK
jgi:acetolactate synthase-1/2/3 large subunit